MDKNIEELDRQDFETWFISIFHPLHMNRNKSGSYYFIDANVAWTAWQERGKALLAKLEAAQKLAQYYLEQRDAAEQVSAAALRDWSKEGQRAEAAEARLLVLDGWNKLGPAYPDHYKPVLVAMNGIVQHITYQIEEGEMGDYWQPVDNEDADGAPMTQFQHWKSLPSGPVNPVEGGE